MSLVAEVRVGRKYALYLPRAVVEGVGLTEGDKLSLKVDGTRIVLEPVWDPLHLALSGTKFASVKPEEVEGISLEEQAGHVEGST